jgi:hypothetical protein
MAMPALMFELETPLEERVARLEANVEHQKDVSDMKIDIRRLGDKLDSIDQKLSAKIDSVDQKLSPKIESVKDSVTTLAINMEKSFANVEKRFTDVEKSFAVLHAARAFDRVWGLLMSGALLGVMARAFKWI